MYKYAEAVQLPIEQGIVPLEACIIVLLPGMWLVIGYLNFSEICYIILVVSYDWWLIKFAMCSKRVLSTTSVSQSFSLHVVTQP